jgi:hypothetical protein
MFNVHRKDSKTIKGDQKMKYMKPLLRKKFEENGGGDCIGYGRDGGTSGAPDCVTGFSGFRW